MSSRVLLLLPTSTYRTPDFMAAASRMGVAVVVASEEPSTMEVLSSDSLLTLKFSDPVACAERVARFHEDHPVDAVIAVDEDTAVAAAAIGARLGLAHNDPDAAAKARAKHRMRQALLEAGVASPWFRVYPSDSESSEVACELSFPVVVKPVFLSGSRGVQRADDPRALDEAFGRLRRLLVDRDVAAKGGEDSSLILVESFVSGPEVALEAILTEGELTPLALFDKPDPMDGPFFEETIYLTPSRLPESRQREIVDVTSRAAKAMGLRHGPIHAELRLPVDSPPVVIEIAGRSIGGLCARALRFGLGMSLEELILRHALRENVETLDRETSASGVMMIPIPEAGILVAVDGVDAARGVPGIDDVTITATLGKRLVPLPEGASYLGFLFARAETPGEVENVLRRAHRHLEFTIG